MAKLFLLFTVVPIVDLWLLLRIGRLVGPIPAVALVLVTGFVGAALAKAEGTRVLDGWRRALTEGRVPDEGVLSGALVLVGGALLVAPGIITDVVGLALLLPATRRLVAGALRNWLGRKIERGQVRVGTFAGPPPRPRDPDDEAIDVTPRRD